MKVKPIVPRELANHDVNEIIAYYLGESAEQAAYGFIDALEEAYTHIGRHPATGSPRYAHELNLPGLRFWPLSRYPHLVFYVERPSARNPLPCNSRVALTCWIWSCQSPICPSMTVTKEPIDGNTPREDPSRCRRLA